jgi:uncharacterized protein
MLASPARGFEGRIEHARMPASSLDYGQLVERALRRVVHDSLAIVAEQGLPGSHHFYITFRTDHPGVVLGDGLRARYPAEMTIVLQNEFWGLEVGPDGFAVTLSFNNLAQRIEIPFEAIRVFADPSVEFGLQFTVPEGPTEARPAAPPPPLGELALSEGARAEPRERLPEAADGEAGSAEVVTLDRFRKK